MLKKFGWTDEPQIIIRNPHDNADESFIVWWHVDAENIQRERCKWWPTKDAEECIVDLKFVNLVSNNILKVEGRWSDDGLIPLERKTLRVGDRISKIPIILRSQRTHLIYQYIGPDIVYITGTQFLIHENDRERLEIGQYDVSVTIRSGNKVWAAKTLRLEAPEKGLEGFTLREHELSA